MTLKHYQVVGRLRPTETQPNPEIYRMKIFAQNDERARSRFWYFMSKLRKMKKASGEILATNEIFETKPTTLKNYGIWLRYDSRSGTHNQYKEFRDVTLCGAVNKLYTEMAARHRVRHHSIQIKNTQTVPASAVKRPLQKQFLNSKIKFPLTHRIMRAPRRFRSTFVASRPNTSF